MGDVVAKSQEKRRVPKPKKGDNWRALTYRVGKCQAHAQKNPCAQCRKDTLKREEFMARERRALNEELRQPLIGD